MVEKNLHEVGEGKEERGVWRRGRARAAGGLEKGTERTKRREKIKYPDTGRTLGLEREGEISTRRHYKRRERKREREGERERVAF